MRSPARAIYRSRLLPTAAASLAIGRQIELCEWTRGGVRADTCGVAKDCTADDRDRLTMMRSILAAGLLLASANSGLTQGQVVCSPPTITTERKACGGDTFQTDAKVT